MDGVVPQMVSVVQLETVLNSKPKEATINRIIHH